MKLKFKADPKDFLIFGVFALFLLYIVAIGILNIRSLGATGEFSGFNPFPAFGSEYLLTTIIFYLIALALLFASVKSYFFDREKGVGLDFNKSDKGYSRWSKARELKRELSEVHITDRVCDHAGIPLINDGKTMYVDDGEYHNIVIGSTGSGKTQCVVHPMVKVLAKKGESMIITDPKAEIYHENAGLLKALGYNIIVLNFREPQKGNMWNPLAMPYRLYKSGNTDKAMELLDDVALNILYEEGTNSEPFWEKTSADYFAGLALGLFEDGKEEEVNINSISVMTSVGEERFGGNSTYIKEYFNMKDPAGAAYTSASGTVMAPNETKGGIISTFKQKIRLFASRENLSEMLSISDFDMESIGRQKTAVFLIIQDEKKTYHALATIFVKQCYEALIDVAMASPKGKLPVRTNFILDEFANMPPLKDVTTMITAARSRQVRFTLFIQNFAQLNQVYGNENAETIRSNCGNLLYLITTELRALEEISKLCGEVKSKTDDKTASTPLVTVSDLQKLAQFECIILRVRLNPFKTKLTPNFKINWGDKKYQASEFVQREKRQISVFDLREFVKEKKKSKIMGMIDDNTNLGNMGGFNPFENKISQEPKNLFPNNESNSQFNIDDLVKKIDAKIAELEEEEKKEEIEKEIVKQEEPLVSHQASEPTVSVIDEEYTATNKVIEDNIEEQPRKQYITDDQFFDDFFGDS